MKRKLLPLAIAAAAAAQSGVVLADATVYGKANLSVQQLSNEIQGVDSKDNWEMLNNASRFGIKGKAKINDDLDAVFKMEYEVFVDDGDDGSTLKDGDGKTQKLSSEFNQRNINAGLSSKTWGQIIGGKNDTPLKMAADGTDMFNDLWLGDINAYMVGENREDNIIIYNTPTMGGFTLTAATMLGEEDGQGDADEQDDGLFDKLSVAAKYAPTENLWFALSADENVQNADIVRFNANAIFGDLTLNAHIQSAEVSNDNLDEDANLQEEGDGMVISSSRGVGLALDGTNDDYHKGIESQDAWMINGKYQIGDWALKAQYGTSTSEAFDPTAANGFDAGDSKEFEATQTAVGVDYAMSKNVTVFAYVAQIDVDADEASDLVDDTELKTGGVGFEVKF